MTLKCLYSSKLGQWTTDISIVEHNRQICIGRHRFFVFLRAEYFLTLRTLRCHYHWRPKLQASVLDCFRHRTDLTPVSSVITEGHLRISSRAVRAMTEAVEDKNSAFLTSPKFSHEMSMSI